MPEITISERDYADLTAYRMLGSVSEINKRVEDLTKDNGKQRDEIRDLKEKMKGLPPEGAVVLLGDDAKAWTDFKALGLEPEDVKKTLEERDSLKAKDAARTQRDTLAEGSKGEGWGEHAPDTLLGLKAFDAVTAMELKEVDGTDAKGQSTKVKVPFFTVDGKQVRASEWVKETAPHLVHALAASGGGSGGTDGGRPFTEQRGGGGDPKKGEVSGGIDDMIARNQAAAKAATPLRRAAAKT